MVYFSLGYSSLSNYAWVCLLARIWLDALTPKQALLATSLAKVLQSKGHEVLLIVRDYDYTVRVAEIQGFKPLIVGGYGGGRLVGKLVADLERMRRLVEVIEGADIDVLIAYPNPSAARVAFGLGIPYIALTDSPHSVIASRLSLPLASYVVFSYCIPRETIEVYTYSSTRLVQYNGFDELEWIKTQKPNKKVIEELGLEEKEYIIVRLEEKYATYYPKEKGVTLSELAVRLSKYVKVVALPRYGDQWEELRGYENILLLQEPVHGVSLEYYAIAVVTGGGTMAREAALLGVPGVNLFPGKLYVDECIIDLGLPLYKPKNIDDAEKLLYKIIKDPDQFRIDTRKLLDKLEKPSDTILLLLREMK